MTSLHQFKKQGFTLIEVLFVMIILSTLVGLMVAFSAYYFQTYSFSFEENQSIGLAQSNLTTLIREIREARSSETGGYPLVDASDTSFTFYADVTNDGKADKVRYFIEGTQLKKGVIEPTAVPVDYPAANEKIRVISDYIDTAGKPLFTYYNGNWPSDTTNNPLPLNQRIVNTRLVAVYLRLNIQNNAGAQPFELTSATQIRSLKSNF